MSESMLLSDAERDRFASWLERNADSARAIFRQLENLPHAAPLATSLKQEIAASLIIAKKLRETESMSIGGKDG